MQLTTEEIKALFYIRSLGKAYIQEDDDFWALCSNNGDIIIREYSDDLLEILANEGLIEFR